MFRQFPKLLAVAAALIFVAGCTTHEQKFYRSGNPWVSHPPAPAAATDLPADAAVAPVAPLAPAKL